MRINLFATCTFGLEAVVVRELADMGYSAKPVGTGRVAFEGDARAIVDANLHLRTADRILIRLGGFPVGGGDEGFDALFEGVGGLPWEQWISSTAAFVVSGRCVRSAITSEPAVQRATKRAIVDRLRNEHGVETLPETGPTVRVEVALVNNVATLTIDSSGSGLHKRGYREGTPGEAALRETLAAGLVLLSVWRPGRPLVDPFCGVGTIAIEAAMIARRMAPGLSRSFDAERWIDASGRPVIERELWEDCRSDARSQIVAERIRPTIHAGDTDERALALARVNAQRAGVDRDIHFVRRDALELTSTLEHGVVITNPPYGERLGGDEHEIESLYRALPKVFRGLPTWSFHILTGRLDLEQLFGQEAHRRRKLYNAKIETTYFSFLGPKPPGMTRDDRAGSELVGEVGRAGGATDLAVIDDAAREPEPSDAAQVEGMDEQPSAEEPAREAIPPRLKVLIPPAFGGLRQRDEREADEFARCLANNLRHLRKLPSRGITCYRVYERDAPDVPLIIDRYEDHYHAVEYERGGGHSRSAAQQADWVDMMRSTIARIGEVPIDHVYLKEKHRQRGLSQHERLSEEGHRTIVQEGGLRFEVNLTDYVDTGLFLDHRLTRAMFRKESAGGGKGGKRVLNLFCYTGAFSVYGAAGGASSTTSVDLSNTYLDWAHRNFALNGMGGLVCRDGEPTARTPQALIRSGVMEFLDSTRSRYDLMIIDPPTFSNSKSTDDDWDVQAHHVDLLTRAARLLDSDGVIYFSTNFRRFKLDDEALSAFRFDRAAEGRGREPHALSIREISKQTVPPEYRNKRIHRCWRMVLKPVATMRPAPTMPGSGDSSAQTHPGDSTTEMIEE